MPRHAKHEPSVYDYLKTTKIDDLRIAQLDSSAKNSFTNKSSIDLWSAVITLNRTLEASRTYAHGLSIPELSAVDSNVIAHEASALVQPSGTEVWRIQSITSSADMTVSLYDGTTYTTIQTGTTPIVYGNLFINNTLYISIANASGSPAMCNIAYHKVGL